MITTDLLWVLILKGFRGVEVVATSWTLRAHLAEYVVPFLVRNASALLNLDPKSKLKSTPKCSLCCIAALITLCFRQKKQTVYY